MTDRHLAAILSADVVGYSRLMAVDEAIAIWERSRTGDAYDLPSRLYLVPHYQAAGEYDWVPELVREILEINPDFRVARAAPLIRRAYPDAVARTEVLLREAGLP